MAFVEIKSDMAGTVWKHEVAEGEKVKEGDVLLILESMKMEIPIMAPDDGVIKEFKVKEGEVVSEGDVIVIME